MGYRIGVDVGGTFTDLVLIDEASGKISVMKVPSTPSSPDRAVVSGIRKILQEERVNPSKVSFVIHGTTVATNAIIERKGVKVALVVTEGFRDVLHIGRQTRPKLYDFFAQRPAPLVPRHLRYEVPERVLFTGEIKQPLDENAVRKVAKNILKQGVKVVVVCLINSYANPAHEQRVKEILEEELPNMEVLTSIECLPEFKEYERVSTAVVNAYVMPIIGRYVKKIRAELHKLGVHSDLHIMQSNGGVMSSETAAKKSVHTLLSGPAAGVIAGLAIGKMSGTDNVITIDMGGTSFDVSLIYQGNISLVTESEIAGQIVTVPMLDVITLGAGGGSIAWIDRGGALQVGPESAGAEPGPVCYNRGGTEPTVTDANLVLGYLNPYYFVGGEMILDKEKSRQAIQEKIAKPFGMTVEEAATGIIKIVNANMVKGIRVVSVERGYDPRQFALVCFGGAGPVHGGMLARELDIPKVIIPISPGVNSALGLLMADFRHDYSVTYLQTMADADVSEINEKYAKLESEAINQMIQENVSREAIVIKRSAAMRYLGQGYELEVEIPSERALIPEDLQRIKNNFHNVHENSYGYRMDKNEVEFVSLKITCVGILPKPTFKKLPLETEEIPDEALKGYREVYMDNEFRRVPIYERRLLLPGNLISGPAIIEQLDSTTVILPDQKAKIDHFRNIIITKKGEDIE